MVTNKWMRIVVFFLVVGQGFTACRRMTPAQKTTVNQSGSDSSIVPLTGEDVAVGDRPSSEGDWRRGQFEIVYFAYDSAKILPSEVHKLEAVATYLKTNYGKLIVEGHTDERGTAEYNRALGERRAQSAREELVRMGVESDRISTISYGKDRPVELSHEEAAWSKNRRCEFLLANN